MTQNSAQTRLFHNVGAKPGLTVRLKGPEGNPFGIGAVIRLDSGGRMGLAREVHGGSGYWSQDAAPQTMAAQEPPSKVWVRWPGGKITIVPIPAGAPEIMVPYE